MPVISNSTQISCWTCKHFQPLLENDDVTPDDGSGECRALPPAQCCSISEGRFEPIFGQIVYAAYTWCSAWMQRRQNLGTIPAPPSP